MGQNNYGLANRKESEGHEPDESYFYKFGLQSSLSPGKRDRSHHIGESDEESSKSIKNKTLLMFTQLP